MEFWGSGRVSSALPLREALHDASRGLFAGSPICRTFVAGLAEFGLLLYVDRAARFRSTMLAVDFLAPRTGARNTEESKGIRFMAPDSIMAKQRSLLYAGLEQLLLPVAWPG